MISRDFGGTIFTMSNDFMDTFIQNGLQAKPVRVNNLFICSIFERGREFVALCQTQPDKVFPLVSDIFRVKMECYPDYHFVVHRGEATASFTMEMIDEYYYSVLEHIGINEVGDPYYFYKEKGKE